MTPGKKQAFEPTGLIPRSIVRTFERFYKQLLPKTKYSAIREYRISRYQVLVSIRCLCTLLILPLVTRIVANWLIFPQIQYFWDVTYQDEHVFSEIDQFSQVIFFDSLLDRGFLADNETSSFPGKTTYVETSSNVLEKFMPVYFTGEKKTDFVRLSSKQPVSQQQIDRVISTDLETSFLLQYTGEICTSSKMNPGFNFIRHFPLMASSPASYTLEQNSYIATQAKKKIQATFQEVRFVEDKTSLYGKTHQRFVRAGLPSKPVEFESKFTEAKWDKQPFFYQDLNFSNLNRSELKKLTSTINLASLSPIVTSEALALQPRVGTKKALRQDHLDYKIEKLNNKVTQDQALQEKIFELAQSSHFHALQSLTNVFADLLSVVVLIFY